MGNDHLAFAGPVTQQVGFKLSVRQLHSLNVGIDKEGWREGFFLTIIIIINNFFWVVHGRLNKTFVCVDLDHFFTAWAGDKPASMSLALDDIVFCITLGTSSVFGALIFFTMIVKTVDAVKSTMAIWADQSGTDITIVVGTGFSIAGLASSSFARVILGIVHIKSFFTETAPIRTVYKGCKRGATIVVGV